MEDRDLTDKECAESDSVINDAEAKQNKEYVPPGYEELNLDERLSKYYEDDCLGRAAEIGRSVRGAIDKGNHDLAWRLIHMSKSLYLEHAAKNGFAREHTLALDGRSHGTMADILKREGKHRDALAHVLYWGSSYDPISKTFEKKLRAYINRAALPNVSTDTVLDYIRAGLKQREFLECQNQVALWSNDD